ncbi:TonB-dependent receptor [Dyella nitratireducens]|uniref:TonB-dependent receptor n=1 Tax=Dyella nitratireducens TaxID=1849580 RepID=A0ABQ1FW16_9GAMM|nr:TonB-dependent receptor [Dyella nitratireducens]GGA31708.1 TonB-dependent receptor [Dyella nitratireducens]GLQ42832.1 TonB-dependent receptor [Dyella nitratireducens]
MQSSTLRKVLLSYVISTSLGVLCTPACVWAGASTATSDHGTTTDSNAAQPATDAEDEKSGKKKVKDLQGVHVVAPRTTEEMARFTQENAPNLINIRTGDEIRALPDVNTAEAVRRIPGISMETDEGEGRYVNIRGFDADLNSTTYAGVRLLPTNNASPFGGYRAVALDSIPTGFIGAVEVTKSNLPSQDAEALGGTIEVLPKTAPEEQGGFLEGDVGGGYEPLRGTGVTNFSLTGGGRFNNFWISMTASKHNDGRGIDDVEPAYFGDNAHPYQAVNDIEQRDYELHRQRHGYAVDMGYQLDDENQWYFRAFEAGYTEYYKRQFFDVFPDGNTAVLPNGQLQDTLTSSGAITKSLRDEQETSRERFYMLGGQNEVGDTSIDYHVAYVEGTYKKPYDYNSTFTYNMPASAQGLITYNNTGPGHVPLYSITGLPGYLDPANYTLTAINNSTAYNFDRESSYAVNSKTPVNWGSLTDQSLNFGISIRQRHKQTNAQPYNVAFTPIPMSQVASGTNETYYGGIYQNGVDIAPSVLQQIFGYGTIGPNEVLSAQQQFLDAHEDIYAGYGEYLGTYGNLGILGGVRYEETRDRSHAFSAGVDASGNIFANPISTRHNYHNLFPSLQFRYDLGDNMLVRVAYSSTIARPGFNQSNPSLSVDLGSGIVQTGNPNLKPATANSVDASFEKYLPGAGIVSVGIFDKEISDYIVPIQTTQAFDNSLFPGNSQPLRVFTYKNAGPSYARGLELNWSQQFQGLPHWLQGLGAGANYTWVDSRFEIRPGQYSLLPSTSKNTWNATLFYKRAGFSVNLAAYSVSSDLFAIGADRSSDIFNASRTSMDLGASYDFPENWSIYFDVKNLLNTPHAFYQGTPDRPIQREFYDVTYLAGIRFQF